MQLITLVVLVIATLAFGISAVLVGLAAPMSFMAFDSGPSAWAWLFVGLMFSYPVSVLASQIAAWWLYGGAAYEVALAVGLLPLLYPAALLLMYVLMPSRR